MKLYQLCIYTYIQIYSHFKLPPSIMIYSIIGLWRIGFFDIEDLFFDTRNPTF